MALPHLNSARRHIYEQAIIHKRNEDNDRREQWSSRAKYFQDSNVTTGKKAAWESNKSYQSR